MHFSPYFIAGAILIFLMENACSNLKSQEDSLVKELDLPQFKVAHLGKGDEEGFQAIQKDFAKRNPGYGLAFQHGAQSIDPQPNPQIVFVQEGGGTARLSLGDSSKVSVGDIIWLAEGEGLVTDSAMSFVSFTVPDEPASSVPKVIRTDWDPLITDIPGGCATETGAYRRILLTWLRNNGPYTYPNLNAHRVRIMDSFSHYHPQDSGFDEFYLVQMVMDGAKILTSNRVDLIENPNRVSPDQVQSLFTSTTLEVGDLVYLPRGVIHRGLGGVLAQVITVPGFVPGAEIGVDHHLKRLNNLLNLYGDKQVPFNEAASNEAVVK
ncbi:MAG: hypothetical protein AAF694_11105 [Bacteroidota bacterium]